MDLTPRLLTEVDFREQWRGYHQGDVDDFLERVAAGVGELQERLREANERVSQAEHRLLERADDDEIRRTLVLAQRTAVTAVEEATAEAKRIVDDADQRARGQLAEVDARIAAAEAELAERTQRELGELADRRAVLQADVDALERFLEEHRARMRAELQRQLAELERPDVARALTVPTGPPAHEVDLSPPDLPVTPIEPVPTPESTVEASVPAAPTDEEVAQAREDLVAALRKAGVEDLLGGALDAEELKPWEPGTPVNGGVDLTVAPDEPAGAEPETETWVPPTDAPQQASLYDDAATADDDTGDIDIRGTAAEPTGMYDVLADDEGDDAPSAAVGALDQGHEDDDPFLTELRRAVTDTEPLGPRDLDEELPDLVGRHEDVPGARFRLRRSR